MWKTNTGNLTFTNNYVKNVHRGSKNGGNMVMVAYVHAEGIRINNNISINILGQSEAEDVINVYKSDGTASDSIQINNNQLYGGGPSPSGGGILLGDGGGSYQEAKNNILVNPGQYGLGIDSGHHNVLSSNKVFSDDQRSFTNVGIGIGWTAGQKGLDCYSLDVSNNEVTWWKGSDFNGGVRPYLEPYPDFRNSAPAKSLTH